MNQSPLDLLSEDDRKELERLLSIVHSETLSTAAKLEEVARLLAKHGLLIPAPVTEQTWSATELAAELAISAQAVGRLATMHNLKVAGFGEWRLGKAPNGKQIETWVYNAAGRARMLDLMEKSHDATCSTISSPAVHSTECLPERNG